MKVAALASGGKDSSYAMYRVLQEGHDITALVAMVPPSPESYMYHHPNIHLMPLYARACGIPLVMEPTCGEKERELDDLARVLATLDVDAVCTGAVASVYQKSRIERVCDELGLEVLSPLWGCEPADTLLEMVQRMSILIVRVAAMGLDSRWLGRMLDVECAQELISLSSRYGVHPMGEGGEYETLVLDAPFFSKRLKVVNAHATWERDSGAYIVDEATLEEKTLEEK